MEPDLKWLDLEDIYTKVYLKGEQADEYREIDGDIEAMRVYLRYQSFNLMIARPLFPENSGGICFYIQVTAPPERRDIGRELYAALEDDDRLYFLRGDILENAGWRRTAEILKMVRQAHIIPKAEFLDETG